MYLHNNSTARSSNIRTLLPTVQETECEQNSEKDQTQSRNFEIEKKAKEEREVEKELQRKRVVATTTAYHSVSDIITSAVVNITISQSRKRMEEELILIQKNRKADLISFSTQTINESESITVQTDTIPCLSVQTNTYILEYKSVILQTDEVENLTEKDMRIKIEALEHDNSILLDISTQLKDEVRVT